MHATILVQVTIQTHPTIALIQITAIIHDKTNFQQQCDVCLC